MLFNRETIFVIVVLCFSLSAPVSMKAQSSHLYLLDSTTSEIIFSTFCKHYFVFSASKGNPVVASNTTTALAPPLRVRGDVLYDANYRSLLDTPFAAKNFLQHYTRVNLQFLIANRYPVQLTLSSRSSNSDYFRNYFDVNVQFGQQEFTQAFKEKLKAALAEKLQTQRFLQDQALREWQQKAAEFEEAKAAVTEPRQLQRLVEAKEFLAKHVTSATNFLPTAPKKETLSKALKQSTEKFHSAAEASDFIQTYETKKAALDSLQKKAEGYKSQYVAKKIALTKKMDSLKSRVNAGANIRDFKSIDRKAVDSLSAKEKFLMGIKTFAVGRSPLNYSELSVQNISLNGFNIEHDGTYYWAVAAGAVDYYFRDFVTKSFRFRAQSLGLVRFGKGDPNSNHLILTGYKGNKNRESFTGSTPSSQALYGLNLEARFAPIADHDFTLEVAKSSALSTTGGSNKQRTEFRLFDHTTTAWAIKVNSLVKRTATRIGASYRFWGANFQSFTLYTRTADQTAWQLSAEQPFWKRRIILKASLRKNDYDNPYSLSPYKSGTIFKSFFLTFRKRNFPYVSVGYMPTSQLTKIDGLLYENRFQMLTATASHFYKLGELRCNTLLSASRYFNSGWDSGFLYANSKNLMLSHSFLGRTLTATTTLSSSRAPDYAYTVIDQGLQAGFPNGFSIVAGMKVNQLNGMKSELGYYGSLACPMKGWGDLSFSFESSWLPGTQKKLLPSDIGRVTYSKRL